MAIYRVEKSRDSCMGLGECVYSAPEAFQFDEDDRAMVIDATAASDAQIEAAVKGCANFAIRAYPTG